MGTLPIQFLVKSDLFTCNQLEKLEAAKAALLVCLGIQTDLDMLFEHVPSILGCLSPQNSLSCLITFMVNIVKWTYMPSLWVKFLPILAKYDDLIQIDNIAHHWC